MEFAQFILHTELQDVIAITAESYFRKFGKNAGRKLASSPNQESK